MDKVTHFLVLTALILFIIVCLMIIAAASCAAGFISSLKPFTQARTLYDQVVQLVSDIVDKVSDKTRAISEKRGTSMRVPIPRIIPREEEEEYVLL